MFFLNYRCRLQLVKTEGRGWGVKTLLDIPCLLYTSDAADDMQCVDLGGRRIIKKSGLRT